MKLTPIKTNMTELETDRYKLLFSYKTPVAYYDKQELEHAKTSKKWSRTTSRHINQWFLMNALITTPREYPQEYFDELVS